MLRNFILLSLCFALNTVTTPAWAITELNLLTRSEYIDQQVVKAIEQKYLARINFTCLPAKNRLASSESESSCRCGVGKSAI